VRIGVNALYLIPGGVGGTEIYLRNLLAAFAEIESQDEYVVFTNRETGADLVPARPNFRRMPQPVSAKFRPARIVWEQIGLPWPARQLDVLLNPGFTAPLLCGCPSVTVFHDLQHKRHPEHFRWFDLPFWRMLLYGSARRSSLLIAVSEATRQDLEHYYPFTNGRICVVPHGVDPRFFEIGRERRSGLTQPYVLCVSTLHPHKNLDRLIRAFARFQDRSPRFRLVIAGLRGFRAEALERMVAERGWQEMVRFTGWIPRERLYELFRGAHAFIYPSTFEGFGMPVLEAMAAGIPLACSAIQPMRTIAGDAALLFDPEREDDILRALDEVAENLSLRTRLSLAGPERARQFSWRATAEATLKVLRRAAG
jgi:glycosyltransferase involved in cell wall biosynthesis